MSVDRIKGEVVFICNGCDDTLETGTRNYGEAHEVRKDESWSAIPPEPLMDNWQHFCPDCKKEML